MDGEGWISAQLVTVIPSGKSRTPLPVGCNVPPAPSRGFLRNSRLFLFVVLVETVQ